VLREVVWNGLAGGAVVGAEAGRAASGALGCHLCPRLVVPSDGDAPIAAEFAEVGSGVAGEALSAGGAGEAVDGAGCAGAEVVELPEGAGQGGLHALAVAKFEGSRAGCALGG
jgi:hypothetical protein